MKKNVLFNLENNEIFDTYKITLPGKKKLEEYQL